MDALFLVAYLVLPLFTLWWTRSVAWTVIALTAFAKEEDRLEALEAGCTEHLVKPVKARDLLSCVVQNMNGKGQAL